MNRRDFLIHVLGATVALPVVQRLGLSAHEPATISWGSTLEAIHREAWRLYKDHIARAGLPVAEIGAANQLGDTLPSGVLLAHWLNVSIERTASQCSLAPVMSVLAQSAIDEGVDSYGTLSRPIAGVEYCACVGALRMVSVYDLVYNWPSIRFDVIGGASPVGLVYQRRTRVENLKRHIRRRLDSRSYTPRPLPV